MVWWGFTGQVAVGQRTANQSRSIESMNEEGAHNASTSTFEMRVCRVKGITFCGRWKNALRVLRGKSRRVVRCHFIHTPENPFDNEAVLVTAAGMAIGHLPRGILGGAGRAARIHRTVSSIEVGVFQSRVYAIVVLPAAFATVGASSTSALRYLEKYAAKR